MMIEIKSWHDGKVLFSGEFGSLKLAVEAAVSQGVSLSYASLVGASLVGARLDRARLDAKQLQMFRDDIWGVLSSAPAEVKGLLKALEDGKVDGSTYEGSCACLVGTIANVRGCKYDAVKGLSPNSSRPAEVWFMQIRKGDTPKTNKAAKQAHEWISQWLETMQGAFAGK